MKNILYFFLPTLSFAQLEDEETIPQLAPMVGEGGYCQQNSDCSSVGLDDVLFCATWFD